MRPLTLPLLTCVVLASWGCDEGGAAVEPDGLDLGAPDAATADAAAPDALAADAATDAPASDAATADAAPDALAADAAAPDAAAPCTVVFDVDSDGDGAPDWQEAWDYDGEGRVVEARREVDGALFDRTTYRYDEAGRLLAVEVIDAHAGRGWSRALEYDAAGHQIADHTDVDGDGAPDLGWTATYDAAGRLSAQERDDDGDGRPDERTTYTYDAQGALVAYEVDWGAEGFVDERVSVRSACVDADCALIRELHGRDFRYREAGVTRVFDGDSLLLEERDDDGDGRPDRRTTWERDGAGRITRVAYDLDLDGAPEWSEWVEAYGPQGQPSVYRREAADGSPRGRRARSFNEAGQVTGEEVRDATGAVRTVSVWAYDAEGRLRDSRTGPGGDLWEWTSHWRYDEAGRLRRYESDWLYNRDEPDTPEEIFTALAWSEAGEPTLWSVDLDGDGVEDQRRAVSLDEGGRATQERTTGEGDEGPDHERVRRLRPDGQLSAEVLDWYRDGSRDEVHEWRYDGAGRLVGETWDWDGGGTDQTQSWRRDERGRLTAYAREDAGGRFTMTARGACAP